jgi:N-acetylmuramoyl-L-alanine amidase
MSEMPENHIVQQGECLTAIAAKYGFADIKPIYEAGENADFRQLRPDPNVIAPGDRIVIPDRKKKSETLATNERHKVVVQVPRRKLRVKLEVPGERSLAGQAFELTVEGRSIPGKVAAENVVEAEVPANATMATLLLTEVNLEVRLAIGHLDPVRDGSSGAPVWSGIQARLHNLGFLSRAPNGAQDDETTEALRRFQAAALGRESPDGAPDDETLGKLVAEHGC